MLGVGPGAGGWGRVGRRRWWTAAEPRPSRPSRRPLLLGGAFGHVAQLAPVRQVGPGGLQAWGGAGKWATALAPTAPAATPVPICPTSRRNLWTSPAGCSFAPAPAGAQAAGMLEVVDALERLSPCETRRVPTSAETITDQGADHADDAVAGEGEGGGDNLPDEYREGDVGEHRHAAENIMATKVFTRFDCATPGITPTAASHRRRKALAIARKNSPMMCREVRRRWRTLR